MYMLVTIPLDFVGAISDRKSGEMTVRPPAPRPPQILAKRRNPKIPDEKTCMSMPLAHTNSAILYDHSLPTLSLRKKAMMAPNAAPSTPKELILAVRLASPVALPTQRFLFRP